MSFKTHGKRTAKISGTDGTRKGEAETQVRTERARLMYFKGTTKVNDPFYDVTIGNTDGAMNITRVKQPELF